MPCGDDAATNQGSRIMLFNIISHWPDILKALAAIVVFVSGTAFALNVLFTMLAGLANLIGFPKASIALGKAAAAVSWFGAEVHVLAIRWGIIPTEEKKPAAPSTPVVGAMMGILV